MLVVAQQGARGIGRQRRLAGARQAEEDRDIALGSDIGRGVHRQHVLVGQQVVQDGEDRLLDLAGVPGAADRHDAFAEIDQDRAVRGGAVGLRIGLEARQVQDGEFRLEALELLGPGPQEHVAGEQVVPGGLGQHAHADAVRRIGAGPAVAHEQLAALGIGQHAIVQGAEALRRDRLVGLAPVDAAPGLGILDEELVVGRAAGMDAGAHDEGAAVAHLAFAAADRFLVERRNRQVPVNVTEVLQPQRLESEFGNEARLLH